MRKVSMFIAKCALKSMALVKPPPPTMMSALHLKQWLYHIVNYAFHRSPQAFFTTVLLLLFFFAVESGWMRRWGVGVGFYCYCSMLSARARPRLWIWTGSISGFSEVHITTSQITTALISAKNDAKKTFFWNKFSTLDVSCSVPLCSIGSYFGEAWVLLSNLLSRLQMKVSGGATHKKLLLLFWSGQIIIIFFFDSKNSILSISSTYSMFG